MVSVNVTKEIALPAVAGAKKIARIVIRAIQWMIERPLWVESRHSGTI